MGKAKLAVVFAAMMPGLAGCSGIGGGPAQDPEVLWQSRGQFVRLESQDHVGGKAAEANSHPVSITPEQLRAALAGLDVIPAGNDEAVRLFGDGEVRLLGERLSQGLAQAGPDQDVTFGIIGYHKVGRLKVKKPLMTTGRVFHSAGQLNLIFGQVHETPPEVDDTLRKQDPRLKPFLPGARAGARDHDWRLQIPQGAAVATAGTRDDWLVFTPEALTAAVPAGARPVPPEPGRSIRERLTILEDLRRAGLVTEEEYRDRRRVILDSL